MYVGNLNWHQTEQHVEKSLISLLKSIPVLDYDSVLENDFLQSFTEAIEIAKFPAEVKRKPRDSSKLHQGFALIRFSTCDTARLAASKLMGRHLSNDSALGPLRAALSRTKVHSVATSKFLNY